MYKKNGFDGVPYKPQHTGKDLSPVALRKAKIVFSICLSECNRVNACANIKDTDHPAHPHIQIRALVVHTHNIGMQQRFCHDCLDSQAGGKKLQALITHFLLRYCCPNIIIS